MIRERLRGPHSEVQVHSSPGVPTEIKIFHITSRPSFTHEIPIKMKSFLLASLLAGLAAAQGAQKPNPYFGGCDYSPIGQNAPYYNCDWLPGGGKSACEGIVPNCMSPCFRAGSQDDKSGFQIVTENDGNSVCRCRCKLN
ncbi:hypothetical protein CB0940_06777 [Cercospora beticola]|uniref:Uncharacterized protein n=2 Tax=Cercospora beticola TaxID=122368 RepID=A0A2G5H932_CERBT|nr:hypothetical protein CB0940_06777 [Cercospora beticola]PIA89048.1 hypothetical protein CB0940_06777 [Cercospora beticola]CAK1358638.1 unnamed protein product [Cercospora beticola]